MFLKASAILATILTPVFLIAQPVTIKGKVIDSLGAPVMGALIQLKTGRQIAQADSTGSFSIYARPGTQINLIAPGFANTGVTIGNDTNITVVLKPYTNPLFVTENSKKLGATKKDSLEVAQYYRQLQANSFNNAENSNIKSTASATEQFQSASGTPGNMYQGGSGLVAEFGAKEGVKGSRYLFDAWANGTVIDNSGRVIKSNYAFYNYDKITGDLLTTPDMANIVILNKNQVSSFILKKDTISYRFGHVPAINDTSFFITVAKGARYAAYKLITTRFEKDNYVSTGITESGHHYDEYIDDIVWYMVDVKANAARQFRISRKSLKEALPAEDKNISAYFSSHADDQLDESFVAGLVQYLNQ